MKEEINKAVKVLENGGLILYPTDTVWGIGCDATNASAVEKVYGLKQRDDAKALICLVANDFMLEKYIEKVPEVAWDILDLSEKPVTIIYDNPKGVAKNLVAADNTLAVRIASDQFCRYLIDKFKKPIVSTSANLSGAPTPKSFGAIGERIKRGVDYVVDFDRDRESKGASTLIKLGNDYTVKILRK